MMDKLLKFKENNKTLYYILLPILSIATIVSFVSKLLMDINIVGAKKSIKKKLKKDFDLEKEQKEAESKAKELLKEAKNHENNAEKHEKEVNNIDVDENWHLRE